MNEQLMYKLAALDAAVTGGFRRLDEKMDRFQTDLHDSQIATNDRINNLDKEVHQRFVAKKEWLDRIVAESLINKALAEKRFVELETWKHVIVAKIGMGVTAAVALITLVAPSLRDFLGITNG